MYTSRLESEKNELHRKLALLLQPFLTADVADTETHELVKNQIRLTQMKARYLCAGGDPYAVKRVCALIDCLTRRYQHILSAWKVNIQDDILKLFTQFPELEKFPTFRKFLQHDLRRFMSSFPRRIVKQMFERNAAFLLSKSEFCSDEMDRFLDSELSADYIASEHADALGKMHAKILSGIKLYSKYQDELIIEMIQGVDDDQEILTTGVCVSVAARVANRLQDNPNLQLTELQDDLVIKPIDRYYQASYAALHQQNFHENREYLFAKTNAKKSSGIGRFVKTSEYDNTESFSASAIAEQNNPVTKLQENNGVGLMCFWMKGRGAHATTIIADNKQHRYGLFDCNFGLFNFRPITQNKELTANRVIECAKDVLDYSGEVTGIELRQRSDH